MVFNFKGHCSAGVYFYLRHLYFQDGSFLGPVCVDFGLPAYIRSSAFEVAQQYDLAVRRASATVVLSSILSIATLSALLMYYEV